LDKALTRIIHGQVSSLCQRCLQGINSSAKGIALEDVIPKAETPCKGTIRHQRGSILPLQCVVIIMIILFQGVALRRRIVALQATYLVLLGVAI
jgi:hypothetical protein